MMSDFRPSQEKLPTMLMDAREKKWVMCSTDENAIKSSWSYRVYSGLSTLPSMLDGDSEMNTARELWEQNRKDASVKRLNDVLSQSTSEPPQEPSKESVASSGAVDPSKDVKEDVRQLEVLFGVHPKRIQSLKAKAGGETK